MIGFEKTPCVGVSRVEVYGNTSGALTLEVEVEARASWGDPDPSYRHTIELRAPLPTIATTDGKDRSQTLVQCAGALSYIANELRDLHNALADSGVDRRVDALRREFD